MRRAAIWVAVFCAAAAAQTGADSPPVLVLRQPPEYSAAARAAGLEGTVVLAVTIGEDGKPRETRVIKSLGLGLDENAIAAVANSRYRPGLRNGKPVAMEVPIQIDFRLPKTPLEFAGSPLPANSNGNDEVTALLEEWRSRGALLRFQGALRDGTAIQSAGFDLSTGLGFSPGPLSPPRNRE